MYLVFVLALALQLFPAVLNPTDSIGFFELERVQCALPSFEWLVVAITVVASAMLLWTSSGADGVSPNEYEVKRMHSSLDAPLLYFDRSLVARVASDCAIL